MLAPFNIILFAELFVTLKTFVLFLPVDALSSATLAVSEKIFVLPSKSSVRTLSVFAGGAPEGFAVGSGSAEGAGVGAD